jgi:hypothetical protein
MLKSASLSLFSLSLIAPIVSGLTLLNKPASAACVMLDVAPQLAIHGSKTDSTQINHTKMLATGPCVGNATVTTGAQTAVTTGEVIQDRSSTSVIKGDPTGLPDVPGLAGPIIQVPVNTQVDVYSPALDNDFMPDPPPETLLPQTMSGIPLSNQA